MSKLTDFFTATNSEFPDETNLTGKEVKELMQRYGEWLLREPQVPIEKVVNLARWLLGYEDFPKPEDKRKMFYWRTHLRTKLGDLGITKEMIDTE